MIRKGTGDREAYGKSQKGGKEGGSQESSVGDEKSGKAPARRVGKKGTKAQNRFCGGTSMDAKKSTQ